MRSEEITLYTGTPYFDFQSVRRLEATCDASTMGSKPPTMETVNAKLRVMAAAQGADAVIDVEYHDNSGAAAESSMTATGLAVRKLPAEIPCACCGELIERPAQHCQFCGHTVTAPGSPEAILTWKAIFTPPSRIAIPVSRRLTRHRTSLPTMGLTITLALAIVAGLIWFVRTLTR